MNTTLNVADAKPGMVALLDDGSGDTATITKVKRPKQADYLKVTFVDDLGSVFTRTFYDAPTPWTLTIQA